MRNRLNYADYAAVAQKGTVLVFASPPPCNNIEYLSFRGM